jgi:NADPH:quinone reductase-like Zn-dependent oxidoreductase
VKTIQITGKGGPEVMAYVDADPPALSPDGIRIAVRATGVNFADLMMRMGMYPEAPKPPFTPGYEVAGDVTEVGSAVLPGTFAKGDRVIAATKFGGYSSEVAVAVPQARKMPEGMSYEHGASIPVNWGTAWVALQEMARVRKGDRVLVHSAAGGVGVAAVQIAVAAGARVVGLTGSPSKSQAIKELGAAEVWTNDEWAKRDSERFDVIIEAIGGSELKRCYARLAPAGRVVTFGVSSMVGGTKRSIFKVASTFVRMPMFTPLALMNANKGIFGLNMLKMFEPDQIDRVGHALDKVIEGFKQKRFRAVVGKTFPLKDAGAAQEHLQSRGNIGKVVLLP